MPFKTYWNPREAVIAWVIATIGVTLMKLGMPTLPLWALPVAWLLVAGFIYQTGCELAERTRKRTSEKRQQAPER